MSKSRSLTRERVEHYVERMKVIGGQNDTGPRCAAALLAADDALREVEHHSHHLDLNTKDGHAPLCPGCKARAALLPREGEKR